MLRWARALPRWMRLLPGVLWKPLVGAVGRSLVVERRFSFLFEFVLEVLINPKFISLSLNACYLPSEPPPRNRALAVHARRAAWGRRSASSRAYSWIAAGR